MARPTKSDLFPAVYSRGLRSKKYLEVQLPKLAHRFFLAKRSTLSLSTLDRLTYPVCFFHKWLGRVGRPLEQLLPQDFEDLTSEIRRMPTSREAQAVFRSNIVLYLEWLSSEGLIQVKLHEVFPESRMLRQPLPDYAEQFLSLMAITLRQATLSGYRGAVRSIHRYLDRRKITLRKLGRNEIEEILNLLALSGLKPSTRVQFIIFSRSYLRWAFEHGHMKADPDEIIRPTDFPKVPEYLPRPLTQAEDVKLQTILGESTNIYARGLLLMRRTGIRVGELTTLTFECVRTDLNGHHFLKVPLGKLYNERHVPIEESTYQLILVLREQSLSYFGQNGGKGPLFTLFFDPKGRKVTTDRFRGALLHATEGFESETRIGTHRLRHTYATTLLNAGVSLVTLMNLLGHRHIKMTLRYAAVTQDTVRSQYFEALERIRLRYQLPDKQVSELVTHTTKPEHALPDLIRVLQQSADTGKIHPRKLQLLIKRLRKLQGEVAAVFKSPGTPKG